jgi:fatty-acyl-CoA synthase
MFESGWLVSGDLGHVDAHGHIHITGRAKDVIIRGSHNIDPALVEEAFLAHPDVAQCAVVAQPDVYAGEVPMAFVVLRPGTAVDAAALLEAVAPQVYERPAVPRCVVLVDTLPMTAIGKVFKPGLRLRAIEMALESLAASVAVGRTVQAQAREEGGTQRARITLSGAPDEALSQRVRAALATIAVPTELAYA